MGREARVLHDWRLWAAVIGFAAVLLAGAVAFATGGFPGSAGDPALPAVVTERPILPSAASSVASVPATSSLAATPAAAPVATPTPAPAPNSKAGDGASSQPRPRPAPERVERKQPASDPDREVVIPHVREKDEDERDDDRSQNPTALRPLGRDERGEDDDDRRETGERDADGDRLTVRRVETAVSQDGWANPGDERDEPACAQRPRREQRERGERTGGRGRADSAR